MKCMTCDLWSSSVDAGIAEVRVLTTKCKLVYFGFGGFSVNEDLRRASDAVGRILSGFSKATLHGNTCSE